MLAAEAGLLRIRRLPVARLPVARTTASLSGTCESIPTQLSQPNNNNNNNQKQNLKLIELNRQPKASFIILIIQEFKVPNALKIQVK